MTEDLDTHKLNEIKALYNQYSSCDRCPALLEHRRKVVFGAGNINADLMIIGEAPSAEDDYKGTPFVGDAGSILMEALNEAGLSRKEVYMTNTVLCRPVFAEEHKGKIRKSNRTPTTDELTACRDRLTKEIYIVDPKVILLLGSTAANLVSRATLAKIAGTLLEFSMPGKTEKTVLKYPAIVTWSPSFLLRGARQRKKGTPDFNFFYSVKLAADLIRLGNHYNSKGYKDE